MTLKTLACWTWLLTLASCQATDPTAAAPDQSAVPRISFYPCEIPTISKLEFCCVTENIHTATVDFSLNNQDIVSVHHPCQANDPYHWYNISCKIEGTKKTIIFVIKQFVPNIDPNVFGCRYYGKSAQYTLFSFQELTENHGNTFVNISHNATLTWDRSSGFKIYNPKGEIILQEVNSVVSSSLSQAEMKYSIQGNSISITLLNIQKADNGTYVLVTTTSYQRKGITLVVLDKLDLPTIHNVSTMVTFGLAWANMTCIGKQNSGAPPYYKPSYEVIWKFPTDASYSVGESGSNIIINNVDCGSDQSQPLFCMVREKFGVFSESQHFYPHTLCSYKPPSVGTQDQDEGTKGGLIAGVVILSFLCFVLLLVAYCGKDNLKRCCRYSCSRCARSPLCVCRRCIKDDLDFDIADEPRFQVPMDFGRREEVDWRHILDLYSGEFPPAVPPPRPVISLPRPSQYPSLPVPREESIQGTSDVTLQLENDESGIDNPDFQDDDDTVTADDVTVSDISTVGATGTDHSTLVKEVETCLTRLKKLLNTAENQVQVRREHIVEDLLNIYTDPTILQSYLHINVLGEPGSDWGGVSRDIFTSFWNEAILLYFKGHDVHVPYLPPHKLDEEQNFLLMGRILAHSTAILGYIPISICKSGMMVTIYNTTHIESNTLLEDFLLYVDVKDRILIQEALNDFSALTEEKRQALQNIFYQFDMGCILKEETFRDQLLNMSRNELCLKPRSLCEKLKQGIPEVHFDQFWSQMTIDHIGILHARLKPTPEKVIRCLKLAEPMGLLDMRRRRVFQYFKDFIEKLGDEELQKFLQFITGQNCVPKHNITVQFSNLSGAERRPIAHTCGYLIEIPEAYDSYDDFEREFNILLHSDILRFDVQ